VALRAEVVLAMNVSFRADARGQTPGGAIEH
jgi:hypothetical protein